MRCLHVATWNEAHHFAGNTSTPRIEQARYHGARERGCFSESVWFFRSSSSSPTPSVIQPRQKAYRTFIAHLYKTISWRAHERSSEGRRERSKKWEGKEGEKEGERFVRDDQGDEKAKMETRERTKRGLLRPTIRSSKNEKRNIPRVKFANPPLSILIKLGGCAQQRKVISMLFVGRVLSQYFY